MTRLALRLGLRATASKAARGRFVALFIVGAVTCTCLVVIGTVRAVADAEVKRSERIGRSGLPADPNVNVINVSRYRDRLVTIVLVPSDAPSDALPVGLSAPVEPGTVRLSPALAGRADDDPILQSWFPQTRGPDLPDSAVGSADDYKAYLGVATEEHIPGVVSGQFPRELKFNSYQLLAFDVFVGLPAVGLLILASRFGRRARRERLAALRLLGFPRLPSRVAMAVETGIPLASGAVVAALGAHVVRPRHFVVPIVDRRIFGADARLDVVWLVGIVGLVAIAGALTGAATRAETATGRIRVWVGRSDPTRAWVASFYAIGTGLLTAAYLRAMPVDPLRTWGVVIVGVGIMGAVTYVSGLAARVLRWDDGPTVWYLAMRKLAAGPRAHTRFAGMAGVVVFSLGLGHSASKILAHPSSTWESHARVAGAETVSGWSSSVSGTPLSLPRPVPNGKTVVLVEISVWAAGSKGPPAGHAVLGSCRELRSLTLTDLDCGSLSVLSVSDAAGSANRPWRDPVEIRDFDGSPAAVLPAPARAVPVRYDQGIPIEARTLGPTFPGLVLNEAALPHDVRPTVTGFYLRTDANADSWERARASLMAANPAAHVDNNFEPYAESNTSTSWLLLGFIFSACVAAIGVALNVLDEHRSADEWLALRAVGVGSGSLIAMRALIGFISALVASAVAIYPATLAAYAVREVIGDDEPTSLAPLVSIASLAVVTVTICSVVSGAIQVRRLTRRTT